jgi:hypothetical protein
MRLVRIQIVGFGRLTNSSFSADRKLTAVLGPNEAGKSTLLKSLLSLNGDDPIPHSARNRTSNVNDEDIVVEAEYRLDPQDTQIFADRVWVGIPNRMIVKKRASGLRTFEFDHLAAHPAKTWKDAKSALNSFRAQIDDALAVSDSLSPEDNEMREIISTGIGNLSAELDAQIITMSPEAMTLLGEQISEQLKSTLADRAAFEPVLLATASLTSEPNPAITMETHLASRRPAFEYFSETDRDLQHEYLFSDLETEVPKALENLMSLAGKSLSEIIPNALRRTAVSTAQDEATETLQHVFQSAWKQHLISVKFGYEPDRIIVLVKDHGPGGQTIAFDERSDGLRTFVALTAFLSTRGGTVPPILLIDEAEARLHWDAQADLISVLQSSSEVGQIIYTTHSPGCLPPDLGTGIIFVQPDENDSNSSRVRRDFWSVDAHQAFGASPILFLMGASAAAFSRVRRAIVAEGPSDMMLLPTLFRAATRLSELDFQVVPGISTTSKEHLGGLDGQGVRVVYLVDGDAQGIEWRRQLMEDGSVDEARIKSLPQDMAVEDLFDRDFYVGLFLELAGRDEQVDSLSLGPGPLKPQLETLCSDIWKVSFPTSVDIAERILSDLDAKAPGEPDHRRVKLAAGAGPALRKLHSELMDSLGFSDSSSLETMQTA